MNSFLSFFQDLLEQLPYAIVLPLLVGFAVQSLAELIKKFLIKRGFKNESNKEISYSEQLNKLTINLNKSSLAVDKILKELAIVAKSREEAVSKLQLDLNTLEKREKETRSRIEALQNVPLVAVEHFAKMTSKDSQRSAIRDYLLFGAGVVSSTVIAILLKMWGWA